jgi:NADH kinase
MVITLGGDGTILHVSHLFGEGECPPVLSFSMGSLGFLLPFRELDVMYRELMGRYR